MSVNFKPSKLTRQIGLFTVVYAIVVAMMAVVVPAFRQVFTAFDATLPPITKIALAFSDLVVSNLPLVAAVYLVALVGYLQLRHFAPDLREEIDSSFGIHEEIVTLFVLGLFFAAMVVAMYLPIFRLGTTDS
jgi:type II secretory pathway component PulF